jgi:hypothetical protein
VKIRTNLVAQLKAGARYSGVIIGNVVVLVQRRFSNGLRWKAGESACAWSKALTDEGKDSSKTNAPIAYISRLELMWAVHRKKTQRTGPPPPHANVDGP